VVKLFGDYLLKINQQLCRETKTGKSEGQRGR